MDDARRKRRVLFTGHALIPKGIALREQQSLIACSLVVDVDSGRIEDFQLSAVIPLTSEFLRHELIGFDLREGLPALLQRIRDCTSFTAEKAILNCVAMAYRKYEAYCEKRRRGAAVPKRAVTGR